LKDKLQHLSTVQCVKDVGIEYFEGELSSIMNVISSIYEIYNQSPLKSTTMSEDFLLTLNRIHYIVNYDIDYFKNIYQHNTYVTNDPIPSEQIYDSYKQFRGWHVAGFPDNYVIRCGLTPIKPNKKIQYHVEII
jgi:hypothetical protein